MEQEKETLTESQVREILSKQKKEYETTDAYVLGFGVILLNFFFGLGFALLSGVMGYLICRRNNQNMLEKDELKLRAMYNVIPD